MKIKELMGEDDFMQLRSKLLSSTDEQMLLAAINALSEDEKAGSGFAKQLLFLLGDSQFPTVRAAVLQGRVS